MNMRVLPLAPLFVAASVVAQVSADTTAHALPFGTVGNTLELAEATRSNDIVESYLIGPRYVIATDTSYPAGRFEAEGVLIAFC